MRNNKPDLQKIARRLDKLQDMASSACGFEEAYDELFRYERKTMRFIDECLTEAYLDGARDALTPKLP